MDKIDVIKIVESIYAEHYNMHRQGAFDFPDEEDWVKEQARRHKFNNPKLYGYIWDEKNNDWVLREAKSLKRMVDKTDKHG